MGRTKSSRPLKSSPIATMPPALTSSGPRSGTAWPRRRPAPAPDVVRPLRVEEEGQPAVGDLGRHLDVPVAEGRDEQRDRGAFGLVQQLERLAQAEPLVGR